MAFRAPLPFALLLLVACMDYERDASDTASPPEADTGTDADDTGSDLEPATAKALCETVFALCDDAWGWSDVDSCAESWLGLGQDWECADIPAYLGCAAPCLESADCDGFGACEPPCWDAHCL